MLLLAQATAQTTVWTPQLILEVLLVAVGGTGVFATLLIVAAKGYWSSTVAPLVEKEIRGWYNSPEQLESRARERATAFKDWYDKKEQHEEREKELQNLLRTPAVARENNEAVRSIIDNEIKRTDGLIAKEVTAKVNDMESRLLSKLDEMMAYQREDTAFKQRVLQELGRLKGAIDTILPSSGKSSSGHEDPPVR